MSPESVCLHFFHPIVKYDNKCRVEYHVPLQAYNVACFVARGCLPTMVTMATVAGWWCHVCHLFKFSSFVCPFLHCFTWAPCNEMCDIVGLYMCRGTWYTTMLFTFYNNCKEPQPKKTQSKVLLVRLNNCLVIWLGLVQSWRQILLSRSSVSQSVDQ